MSGLLQVEARTDTDFNTISETGVGDVVACHGCVLGAVFQCDQFAIGGGDRGIYDHEPWLTKYRRSQFWSRVYLDISELMGFDRVGTSTRSGPDRCS